MSVRLSVCFVCECVSVCVCICVTPVLFLQCQVSARDGVDAVSVHPVPRVILEQHHQERIITSP